MELEFKDFERLDDEVRVGYSEHKIQAILLISRLEKQTEITSKRFMLEDIKFDLLNKDIAIMHKRMTDETLDKIADIYKNARVELEKIVAEAEPKE